MFLLLLLGASASEPDLAALRDAAASGRVLFDPDLRPTWTPAPDYPVDTDLDLRKVDCHVYLRVELGEGTDVRWTAGPAPLRRPLAVALEGSRWQLGTVGAHGRSPEASSPASTLATPTCARGPAT